jgi:hypothetical protein
MNGYELWRGESLLDGSPIVFLGTGYEKGSQNAKTGAMVQTWILRSDMPPVEALRSGADETICGDCPLRGELGKSRGCYVNVYWAPTQIYRAWSLGKYGDLKGNLGSVRELHVGRSVRLGAYGDPAAVPFEVLSSCVERADNYTGYTHQWMKPETDPRLQLLCMASCETLSEMREANRRGWRTFRTIGAVEDVRTRELAGRGREILCPASKEAGHRTTCEACGLCKGAGEAANIAIVVHGAGKSFARKLTQEEEEVRRAA